MVLVVFAVLALVGVGGFVVVPRIGWALTGIGSPTRAGWLPWAAAGLFTVSWLLPNPSLEHTQTFTQHAVGGGVACAFIGAWFACNGGVRSWVLRVVLAYATAASLGVGVELAELAYDQWAGTTLAHDAGWDLLANTTGAVAAALGLEALLFRFRRVRLA